MQKQNQQNINIVKSYVRNVGERKILNLIINDNYNPLWRSENDVLEWTQEVEL